MKTGTFQLNLGNLFSKIQNKIRINTPGHFKIIHFLIEVIWMKNIEKGEVSL